MEQLQHMFLCTTEQWPFFIDRGKKQVEQDKTIHDTDNQNTKEAETDTNKDTGKNKQTEKHSKVLPNVINMSSITLTEAQIELFGLKFTPTPPSNPSELETDVKTFCRRLRLKERFFDNNDDNSNEDDNSDEDDNNNNNSEQSTSQIQDDTLVRNKSTYNPKPNRNQTLDNCINALSKVASEQSQPRSIKNNLSKKQQKALKELQNNDDIIIKKADKGGAICIMDRSFYEQKMTAMLDGNTTYKKAEINLTQQVTLGLKKNLLKNTRVALKTKK